MSGSVESLSALNMATKKLCHFGSVNPKDALLLGGRMKVEKGVVE